jgi:hypothetical protein
LSIAAGGVDTVAFAILAGSTLVDIKDAARRADSVVITDVADGISDDVLPSGFSLHQNYPNPFNPATTIPFDLPRASEYTLSIYNVLGQVVHRETGKARAGRTSIVWDASDHGTGIYLYRVRAGDYTSTRKMLLLK